MTAAAGCPTLRTMNKSLMHELSIPPHRNKRNVHVLAVGYRNYRMDVLLGLTRGVLSYLTVVLDTGASLSIIRENCLPPTWREGEVENPKPGMRVLDANGNRIPPRAIVHLHLQVGGLLVKQKFLVVDNLSVPCIIGCDFIDKHIETIHPRKRYVVLSNEERIHIGRRRPSQLSEEAPKPRYWPPRRKPPIKLCLLYTSPSPRDS